MRGNSIKEYFDQINLIFYAMIGGPMLAFGRVYLPIKDQVSFMEGRGFDMAFIVLCAAALVLVVSPFPAGKLFHKNLKQITPEGPLKAKLNLYKQALLVTFAIIMGASLIAIGLLFVTKNQLFVAVYALLLFFVSFHRPTLERLCRHLPLSEEELQIVKKQGQMV